MTITLSTRDEHGKRRAYTLLAAYRLDVLIQYIDKGIDEGRKLLLKHSEGSLVLDPDVLSEILLEVD